jgi:hypothetical protein
MARTRSKNSSANLGFEAKLWLKGVLPKEYVFLKYISDAFEEHHATLLAGKGEYAGADPRCLSRASSSPMAACPPTNVSRLREFHLRPSSQKKVWG